MSNTYAAHYDPKKVGQVWEPNYEMLAVEGQNGAKRHGINLQIWISCGLVYAN
jgi:hypothetical protein